MKPQQMEEQLRMGKLLGEAVSEALAATVGRPMMPDEQDHEVCSAMDCQATKWMRETTSPHAEELNIAAWWECLERDEQIEWARWYRETYILAPRG